MNEVPTFTWLIEKVVKVTDGDTIRANISRMTPIDNEFDAEIKTHRQDKGTAIRLIIVDTPERGRTGYDEAKQTLAIWLTEHEKTGLMVTTYASAGWDRLLGDVYAMDDVHDTATQHMLQSGYVPYVQGQ